MLGMLLFIFAVVTDVAVRVKMKKKEPVTEEKTEKTEEKED